MERDRITPALVARLVAEQFPRWAHLSVAQVELDGWDNRTFRLGTELSVRLPSAGAYAAQVDKEHRWLPVLAPHLPLRIPEPVAKGVPTSDFPRPWSVYRWLPGEPGSVDTVADVVAFAADLAGFLGALYRVDADGGPSPGPHSFFRGGSLATYDAETRTAIDVLGDEIDARAAAALWDEALASTWDGDAVWVHGDVTASNLLVVDGRLSAVIDFGCSAVGDPACDLAIAWTFFSGESRTVFRSALPLDEGTWARGRGWALWKALITRVDARSSGPDHAGRFGWRYDSKQTIEDVLTDDLRPSR